MIERRVVGSCRILGFFSFFYAAPKHIHSLINKEFLTLRRCVTNGLKEKITSAIKHCILLRNYFSCSAIISLTKSSSSYREPELFQELLRAFSNFSFSFPFLIKWCIISNGKKEGGNGNERESETNRCPVPQSESRVGHQEFRTNDRLFSSLSFLSFKVLILYSCISQPILVNK